MNNSQLISALIDELALDPKTPLVYQDEAPLLTYGQLNEFIIKKPNNIDTSSPYAFLPWSANNKDFICEYFQLINNGIIPILVDKRRLQSSPQDYDLKVIEKALEKKQLGPIINLGHCATVVYTSGSTGKPKGVRLSLENILNSAKATRDFYQLQSSDNWALSLPLYHIGGLMILWRTLVSKASVTITSPTGVIEDIIANKQVTIASLVQLQLEKILQSQDSIERFKKLKGIILGGSKITPTLLKKAIEHNIHLSNSFGSTESCAQFLATPFSDNLTILSTSGKLLCKANRITLTKQQTLTLEGKSIALGYLNDENFDGKFKTKDQAYIDGKGNYIILGRSDNVFQKAAENINPQIIEDKLNSNLETSSYIWPIKNERYENLIGLICDEKESLSKIKEVCEKQLISFERPHIIYQSSNLSKFQKGIKINRGLITKAINKLFPDFNEKIKLILSGDLTKDLLIISHGFMSDTTEFDTLLSRLKKKYLLVYIDLPGHGQNNKLNSLEDFEDAIIELILNAGANKKKVNFLTYSMSARIFQQILRNERLQNSDFLNEFINESGSPGFLDNQEKRDKRYQHDKSLFNNEKLQNGPHNFFATWYQQGVFKNIENSPKFDLMLKQKTKEFSEMWKYWSRAAQILSVAKQNDMSDLRELPRSISYHYIHGQLDTKYSSYAKVLAETGAKTYEIKNASHNTHFMEPAKYLEIIEKILM